MEGDEGVASTLCGILIDDAVAALLLKGATEVSLIEISLGKYLPALPQGKDAGRLERESHIAGIPRHEVRKAKRIADG
jgi:hypothetical protein